MDTRLLLISHASTAAMRAGRFPADDPLDARGLAEAAAARARLSIPDDAAVFVSPAVCARDTASALGLGAAALGQGTSVDKGLADMHYGLWHGRRLADLALEASHDLATWTHDPDAAAHGGESFSQLVKRVGQWLDALNGALSEGVILGNTQNVVAVTHAPVIRAAIVHALGAPPAVFPRIEIAPLSMVELRRSRRGWTWWPASQ
ncbi:histidine phosphatase family protein [Paraburkholderia madseniana]|uniref:Histidine phosphatase family protein n=1 Tax=Paraburkholderia madseniana TaxID=2599607 RepID=A0A6N6WMD2_9BURK|nr:histidine phosphatase family protein [Paraburkholderia madseniana]KAE8761795.1 histidine phosphatase family protein [Paraburkholderia madseniana]